MIPATIVSVDITLRRETIHEATNHRQATEGEAWRLRRDGKLPKPKKLGNRNVTLEEEADKAIASLVGL